MNSGSVPTVRLENYEPLDRVAGIRHGRPHVTLNPSWLTGPAESKEWHICNFDKKRGIFIITKKDGNLAIRYFSRLKTLDCENCVMLSQIG